MRVWWAGSGGVSETWTAAGLQRAIESLLVFI